MTSASQIVADLERLRDEQDARLESLSAAIRTAATSLYDALGERMAGDPGLISQWRQRAEAAERDQDEWRTRAERAELRAAESDRNRRDADEWRAQIDILAADHAEWRQRAVRAEAAAASASAATVDGKTANDWAAEYHGLLDALESVVLAAGAAWTADSPIAAASKAEEVARDAIAKLAEWQDAAFKHLGEEHGPIISPDDLEDALEAVFDEHEETKAAMGNFTELGAQFERSECTMDDLLTAVSRDPGFVRKHLEPVLVGLRRDERPAERSHEQSSQEYMLHKATQDHENYVAFPHSGPHTNQQVVVLPADMLRFAALCFDEDTSAPSQQTRGRALAVWTSVQEHDDREDRFRREIQRIAAEPDPISAAPVDPRPEPSPPGDVAPAARRPRRARK